MINDIEVIMTCKPDDEQSSFARLASARVTGVRLIAKRLKPSSFVRKVASLLITFPQLDVYIDMPGGKPQLNTDLDFTEYIGGQVEISPTDDEPASLERTHILLDGLAPFWDMIQPNTRILIADGALELIVTSRSPRVASAKVVRCDRPIEAGRSANILPPAGRVPYQSITDSDLSYIEALSASKLLLPNVAILASFASADTPWSRLANVVQDLRIIPKVETPAGVKVLEQFAERYGTVMIGRADLSLETSREQCDKAVREALSIAKAREDGRIIVGSLLLDSLAQGTGQASPHDIRDVQSLFRQGARRFLISGAASTDAPVEAAMMLRALSP